ncbi:MAG: hypothetical protein JW928_07280 [Candidatus Aureabacteria bacterium]|nr:hypothetical protein [Candidatus Auribacterota bacterium]
MILTQLKQISRYYLEEKELETAFLHYTLFERILIDHQKKKRYAVIGIRESAEDFFFEKQYRAAAKFYNDMRNTFGQHSLRDVDQYRLAKSFFQIGYMDKALEEYKTFTSFYAYSPLLTKAYKDIANIYYLCGNKIMFQSYTDLSKGKVRNRHKSKRLSKLRRGVIK